MCVGRHSFVLVHKIALIAPQSAAMAAAMAPQSASVAGPEFALSLRRARSELRTQKPHWSLISLSDPFESEIRYSASGFVERISDSGHWAPKQLSFSLLKRGRPD